MFSNGYYMGGMHIGWWIVWLILVFWVFATPYRIPGQRWQRETPLDVIKRRYAAGEINTEEYNEKKKNIEADLIKQS